MGQLSYLSIHGVGVCFFFFFEGIRTWEFKKKKIGWDLGPPLPLPPFFFLRGMIDHLF